MHNTAACRAPGTVETPWALTLQANSAISVQAQLQSDLLKRSLFKPTLSISEQAQLLTRFVWHGRQANNLDKQTCWPTPANIRLGSAHCACSRLGLLLPRDSSSVSYGSSVPLHTSQVVPSPLAARLVVLQSGSPYAVNATCLRHRSARNCTLGCTYPWPMCHGCISIRQLCTLMVLVN